MLRNTIRILAMIEARSVSGSAKAVLEFAQEARRAEAERKIELSIMTFSRGPGVNSLTTAIRKAGIPLDVVFERGRFDRGVIPQLRNLVKKRNAELIWSNSVKSHFLVRWAGLHKSCRWVAFHHGYTTTDLKMRLYNQMDRWSLSAADRVVTSSKAFMPEMGKANVDVSKLRVQHMPLRLGEIVPTESILRLRDQLGLGPETRVLLSVGRLSQEKGHEDFIHAFANLLKDASLGSLHLVLVGEGPERHHIERLCRSLRIARSVTLTGHQDYVNPYYDLADVFVLPSHREGSPNVLLEAAAARVPIVATAVGGVPEIVSNHSQALLVRSHDYLEMGIAIARLLKDHALCNRLTTSAFDVVSQKTPEAYFQSMFCVFDEAMSQ